MTPLRICLDARVADGLHGGVQQAIAGLARAFSALDDGPETYLFLTSGDHGDWIRPLVSGPCRILEQPHARRRPFSRTLRRWRAQAGPAWVQLPQSDGTIERAGVDVMHFTMQTAFLTAVPSVYEPHDLQHLHLPELFERQELAERTAAYRGFSMAAELVIAKTAWGSRDLVRAFDLAADRVAVVPNAPMLDAHEPDDGQRASTRAALDLPAKFLFYPAATWPHKNHAALFDALRLLRDRDQLTVPLVCSGMQTDHYRELRARLSAAGLDQSVRFVGWVDAAHVRALYSLAHAVVFPSLFEGFGMPVVEAFAAGIPVAASNATCLPELAAGAAALFDPRSAESMAAAVRLVWLDERERARLIAAGRVRGAAFSWDRSARLFRAHYRRIGRRDLTPEDRALLAAPALA